MCVWPRKRISLIASCYFPRMSPPNFFPAIKEKCKLMASGFRSQFLARIESYCGTMAIRLPQVSGPFRKRALFLLGSFAKEAYFAWEFLQKGTGNFWEPTHFWYPILLFARPPSLIHTLLFCVTHTDAHAHAHTKTHPYCMPRKHRRDRYGVATISRLLKITGLFCRILPLL